MTTELGATITLFPIVTSPITFAPTDIETLSPIVAILS